MKSELKDLSHQVFATEFDVLARKFKGLSCSDTSLVVQKASQFCMDKVLTSQQFVQNEHSPMLCSKQDCEKWHPCLEETFSSSAAEQDPTKGLVEFCVPPITVYDLFASFKKSATTVDGELLYAYQKWGNKKGLKIKEPLARKPEEREIANHIPYCQNCECNGCEDQR